MDKAIVLHTSTDIHISMAISTAWKYLGYENGPWVKAHRAILADMGAFSVALTSCYDDLKKGQPLQAWRISNLQDWWAIFVRNVHQYHDQHQLIIVPELVKRGLVIPSHTYSQDPGHLRSLQAMTAQLYALVPNQCHATDLVTFKLLLVRYEALYSRMRDLLQQEEEAAMPLMQKEMPRKQWRMIEDQILKTSDKKTMGWILHAMESDRARREWMTHVAGMSQWVQRLVMLPAARKHTRRSAKLLEEARTGRKKSPKKHALLRLFTHPMGYTPLA